MNVRVSRIAPPSSVTIDPFEPMLSTMASRKILKIIRSGDPLAFGCTKEVSSNRVSVVAERNLDRALESMDVSVVAGPLVCLVFLHQGQKLFYLPPFRLEIIVI